jgi:hypothetical protein
VPLAWTLSHFVIIAVEKEPPYVRRRATASARALSTLAREQVKGLLRTYAMCEALDSWPAFGDDVKDISLPTWAFSQMDAPTPFGVGE